GARPEHQEHRDSVSGAPRIRVRTEHSSMNLYLQAAAHYRHKLYRSECPKTAIAIAVAHHGVQCLGAGYRTFDSVERVTANAPGQSLWYFRRQAQVHSC